jgi:cytochrome P450
MSGSQFGRLPLIGDYLDFRGDRLDFWTDRGSRGPVVPVRFGAQEFWIVTDPTIAEHVLLKNVKDYPRDRRLMKLNRGPGPELMFNTDDWEEWKWRRRLLTPAFRRRSIAGFAETMVDHAIRAAGELSGRVMLQEALRTMTMRMILETMFSVTDAGEVEKLKQSFEQSSEVVSGRASAPLPVPYWLPTPANVELGRLTKYRWKALFGIVQDRIEGNEPAGDLLDMLITEHLEDDGRSFGPMDLVGEMSGIVFAGHETTAETQTWLLYLLSTHPEMEDRVRTEIADVVGDRRITVNDLDQMPLVERVILETMRLYPPVYLTIREADVAHTVSGVEIPVGTRLVINIRGLHRDPAAWSDPDRFEPDRFDPDRFEATGGRHRFQYIPFLDGPKKCLGDHFAMMEMRLTVPTLLQRLRFEYEGERPPEAKAGFTMSVDNGMPMRVHGV